MIRLWARRVAIVILLLVVLAFVGYGALFIPAVYFHVAFFLIQHNALAREQVDWIAVRREADGLMRGARTTRDTYPAIRLVLKRLGDEHSHLAEPETVRAYRAGSGLSFGLIAIWPESTIAVVSPGGPAEEAGLRVGDIVQTVDGVPPAHARGVVRLPPGSQPVSLLLRRTGRAEPMSVRLTPRSIQFNQPASVRRLDQGVGYIEIPGVAGGGESFDREALAAMREADTAPICGWVVDLRRNLGGNMWPMLHAVRPILGEGNPFSYRFGKGPWSQEPVYTLKQPKPAIAVLTSRLTVSSGELLTIAFRGPSSTRSFGEATSGLPTSNMSYPLVDGAVLVVTTTRPADRMGRAYDGPIQPDQSVAIDWKRLGSEDDPVARVASAWLREQSQCRTRH